MEQEVIEQIEWNQEQPKEEGFYLFLPFSTDENWPAPSLVHVKLDYGTTLIADSDDWPTFYHVSIIDDGYWSKIEVKQKQ